MRINSVVLSIPLALLPVLAAAQATSAPAPVAQTQAAKPAAAAAADESAPWPTTTGTINFGSRTTSISGDGARYERYRDMSDGLFVEGFRFATERRGWVFDTLADHVGRRDQRYSGSAVLPGRFKVWGQWDQIPMLMSRTTQTLFTSTTPGVLQLDDAVQASVQAQATAAGQGVALANAVTNARQVELSSRRHIFEGGAQYIGHTGLTLTSSVRHVNRDGQIPFGGSFGHSNVVETMAPVKHQLSDIDTSAEYAQGNLLVRGGYDGSWFHNDVTSLTFDNPWRLTDIGSAGSRGRTSLPPSNSFMSVNGMLSYRLPHRSRATLYGSLGSLRDAGDPLLPFTVNTALPVVPLDRATTDGHASTSSINASFSSRPTKMVDVDVRFRTYDYNNRTPEFRIVQRVGYDNAVSVVSPAGETEPFGLTRSTFDADVRLTPVRIVSAGIGFTRNVEDRTHRIFEQTRENVVRVTADSVTGRWFTMRTKFEHGERRGEGSVSEIAAELSAIGEQPGMRHFDIASRNRNRITVTAAATPLNVLSFDVSAAAGKDDFIESEFGLRDNQHRVYGAGVELSPTDEIGGGVSYSLERYTALSRSRQANPGVQFTDPSRNWATDSLDRSGSWTGHAEWLQIKRKLDVNLFGDLSRSRGLYRYITGPVVDRTLPEEAVVPTTLPQPTQLPLVRSELSRVNLDVVYALTARWGLGTSFGVERYRVSDFTLDSQAISRVDLPGALLLGYQYLPYTAKTFWVRAIYRY
ncbi:MAG: MtrB/PioB family outer membrane beta-barrel protein [Vicinamibacterales bacterium]